MLHDNNEAGPYNEVEQVCVKGFRGVNYREKKLPLLTSKLVAFHVSVEPKDKKIGTLENGKSGRMRKMGKMGYGKIITTQSYLSTCLLNWAFPCRSRSSSSNSRCERLLNLNISSESSPTRSSDLLSPAVNKY